MHALEPFHPRIRAWFSATYGEPTGIQRQAWPVIAGGEHVLVTAPTGCGKTLTAFLWALDRLVTGAWDGGPGVRVLYVSPLKALNSDIRRNLLEPLDGLKRAFGAHGEPFRDVAVQTRSGDTPQRERRRMAAKPPEILITTPESLNILLSTARAERIFRGLRCVIMDEVHAVVGNRRGTHLITGVERLTEYADGFQRIALSATVAPLERVAAFTGGYEAVADRGGETYRPRPVRVLHSDAGKRYDIRIRFPEAEDKGAGERTYWDGVAAGCRGIMQRNRSTLVFVNNRALAEKLTYLVNAGLPEPAVCAHHGSLAREVRTATEERFKAGRLKGIVATSSLEMGIDIGDLDEVVLVQAPLSVSSAVQRMGRAGHRVGEVCRCTIFPSHAADVLQAAVLARCVRRHDIEPVRIPENPLDVLAQIIVSMCAHAPRSVDGMYRLLMRTWPYRHLSRERFDGVIDMLAGRYAETRIRELKPRVIVDPAAGTVLARRSALFALYAAGGTIPDRGYYRLRHQGTRQVVGELDEEYVWERRVNDRMTFGNRNWIIKDITHNDVLVVPARSTGLSPPFWKNEENLRDSHFAARIAAFLQALDAVPPERQADVLRTDWGLDENAAASLAALSGRQRNVTGAPLPHAGHVVVEHAAAGPGAAPGMRQVVLHTMWGGTVNQPFALALGAAWEREFGERLELFAGNEAVVLQMPRDIGDDRLLGLVTAGNFAGLLHDRLEGSGFFGARFRECAGRALLVGRRSPRDRLPLWMNRLRSQKLLKAVLGYADFPVLVEAWRTCLYDSFDLDGLREKLHALEDGTLAWTSAQTTAPSPFASDLAWRQVNQYMYMDDSLAGAGSSGAGTTLLQEVTATDALRPAVPRAVADAFTAKRQRCAPGYAPSDADELFGWVQERRFIPLAEWDALLVAVGRDRPAFVDAGADARIVRTASPETGAVLVCTAGDTGAVETLWTGDDAAADPASLVGEWLGYRGPVTEDGIRGLLGIAPEAVGRYVDTLLDDGQVIRGPLIEDDAAEYVCDAENYETLLRMRRRAAVPDLPLLPAVQLQPFITGFLGGGGGTAEEDVFNALERLTGFGAPAERWERELLPVRAPGYRPDQLDTLIAEGGACWRGCGDTYILFHAPGDEGMLPVQEESVAALSRGDVRRLLPGSGRLPFERIGTAAGEPLGTFVPRFWRTAWDGRVTADSFVPVRQGIANGFKPPAVPGVAGKGNGRMSRRRGFGAWKARQPLGGNWYAAEPADTADDPLDEHERNRERVRLLLDRYGILFRELLDRELPGFRWRDLFRTMRIMELGGEVVGSVFFEGVSGPQYVRPYTAAGFRRGVSGDRIYWLNAADPACVCGLGRDAVHPRLPHRVDTAHIAFRGSEPMLVSKRHGKELLIYAEPADPDLPRYLEPLRHLLSRAVDPLKRIVIETINGTDAGSSEYVSVLKTIFEVHTDFKRLDVYRKRTEIH